MHLHIFGQTPLAHIDPSLPLFEGQGESLDLNDIFADFRHFPRSVGASLGTVKPSAFDSSFQLNRSRDMAFPAVSGVAHFIQMGNHGEVIIAPRRRDPGAGVVFGNLFKGVAQAVVHRTHHNENSIFCAILMFPGAASVNPDFPLPGNHHGTVGVSGSKGGDFGFKDTPEKSGIFHVKPFRENRCLQG